MKPIAVVAASLVLTLSAVMGLNGDLNRKGSGGQSSAQDGDSVASVNDDQDAAPLVVHEWGTFTSFSGSDGVKLEFRPLVDNDLPAFVYNWSGLSAIPFRVSKTVVRALQRMETPVTYFYTPIERDVSVRVKFPEGLLTEFYPPVRQVEPRPVEGHAWTGADKIPTDGSVPLKDGLLDWGTVHLIPPASLRAHVADEELSRRIGRHVEQSLVPEATGNFLHYVAARDTDSAIVQFRYDPKTKQEDSLIPWDVASTDRPIDFFEKFLFYRGVGNFQLPLTLSETGAGEFELVNSGAEEIRSLFLVTVEGKSVRFNRFDRIAGGDRMLLRQSSETSTIGDLAASMVASLTAEGLYEKEARAMVRCWQSSWFGEDGTRLLYMVPQPLTDSLLPLEVDPHAGRNGACVGGTDGDHAGHSGT